MEKYFLNKNLPMNNILDLLVEEAQDIRQRITDNYDGSRYALLKLTTDLENFNDNTHNIILNTISPLTINNKTVFDWIRNSLIGGYLCFNAAETFVGGIIYVIIVLVLSIWYIYDQYRYINNMGVVQTSRILLIRKRISKLRNIRVNKNKLAQSIRKIRFHLGS